MKTVARYAAFAAIFAVLLWTLGTGPFLDGLRTVDASALLAATAIGGLTTVSCAWRWTLVARSLGIELRLRDAVTAYYRSLFLNLTLPGGVVGDVHRGISHGRDVSNVPRGLQAVAYERVAGQMVQAVITVVALLALPSPVRAYLPWIALGLAAVAAVLLVVARWRPAGLRLPLSRRAWLAVTLASAVVVLGHTATFLIAARTAGVDASLSRLLPLALLVLLAAALPGIAGWGPREGATAWAFGAAGLGASQGVAAAVVYGVMVLVASLPGAGVLVADWFRRPRPRAHPGHA